MIVSRGHLVMERVVGDNGVLQYGADGSGLASNKKVFLALGPVEREVLEKLERILPATEAGADQISITPETAREVLKNVPRDKKYGGLLEHVDMRVEGATGVCVEMTDGKRTKKFQFKRRSRTFDAGGVLRRVYGVLEGKGNAHLVLNRKRLLMLLEGMERVSEDASGESPVWLSISEEGDIALRGWDFKFGRPVLGYMRGYGGQEAEAPPRNKWEQTLTSNPGILNTEPGSSRGSLPGGRKLFKRRGERK